MPAPALRVAVLISGRGSNLQALIHARNAGPAPFQIVLVASNKIDADGLRLAEGAGIPTLALDPVVHAGNRAAYDTELFRRIALSEPDLIVLAGFMRILDTSALAPWLGKIINIHPSLLPQFPGLHTHRRAIAAGESEHGASVHFVTAELDGGPLIAQCRLAIDAADTADRLAERLLPLEHRLLVDCVTLFAQRRIALAADGVRLDGQPLLRPLHADFLHAAN